MKTTELLAALAALAPMAHDPSFKVDLFNQAFNEINKAIIDGYYDDYKELWESTNFSEITDWLGWPDFQDGGIFEQVIVEAIRVLIKLHWGYTMKDDF